MRNSPSFIHSSASSVPGSSRLPASGRSLPPRLPFRSRIPVPRSSDPSWQSLLSGIIVYRSSFIVRRFGRNPLSAGSLKGNAALRQLTHHQPCGWSPALEKGGYTLGLMPIAFCRYKGIRPAYPLSALCKRTVPRPCKGRYSLGLMPIVFCGYKGVRPAYPLSALCKRTIPVLAKAVIHSGLRPFAFYNIRKSHLCIPNKGPCAPRFYPPFARAGVSMRSMGGGLAAPAAFSFNGICGRRFLPSADYGISMDSPLPRRSCSSLFTLPCHSKLP